jgi:hypothetical protein
MRIWTGQRQARQATDPASRGGAGQARSRPGHRPPMAGIDEAPALRVIAGRDQSAPGRNPTAGGVHVLQIDVQAAHEQDSPHGIDGSR